MFELIFGLAFLTISAIVIVPVIITGEAIELMFVFLIFPIVGIIMFVIGLIKVIRDAKTSIKGEVCYASISDLFATNKSINESSVMKAVFNVYLESEHRVVEVEEEIGVRADRYPIGSYVKVKYYNNDINVLEHIEEQEVPSYALERIKVKDVTTGDIIVVDGVKYKRIEE